jgi:hypothetical protein
VTPSVVGRGQRAILPAISAPTLLLTRFLGSATGATVIDEIEEFLAPRSPGRSIQLHRCKPFAGDTLLITASPA